MGILPMSPRGVSPLESCPKNTGKIPVLLMGETPMLLKENIMRTMLVALAVLAVLSTAAWATLCDKCKGGRYIMSVGHCRFCGGTTSSGAFHICKKCSA